VGDDVRVNRPIFFAGIVAAIGAVIFAAFGLIAGSGQ
jgi:hypothetical protein